MSEFLFDDFNDVSAKQWKQKIQYDLKGADYNDTLVWQSLEGVNVKPFYHSDDFNHSFPPIPGQPNTWNIGQEVFIDDYSKANHIALDALNRGAEAIVFRADKEFDLETVFKDFPFNKTKIYFQFGFLSKEFIEKTLHFLSTQKAEVFFNIDPIGSLAKTGNWFHNEKSDLEIIKELVIAQPTRKLLGVNISIYQNAGANIVQQLAYAIGHANEYLNRVPLQGENLSLPITFHLSIGSNYFFEIAKIRALRKLYAVVAKEYGFDRNCHIIAQPSKRNKTLYDYNVNMLRTTTECMSAILGGANSIYNLPYDALYHKSNEFGERIARNQLLILKNESYFDTVANAADGAYYIESLTESLANKALDIFKEIEVAGGFLEQLKEGTIQRKIKESAQKEQELFDKGDLKLLGTNYHGNKNDRMKGELELFPFVKNNPIKTLIAPIVGRRLGETTEQERLKQES